MNYYSKEKEDEFIVEIYNTKNISIFTNINPSIDELAGCSALIEWIKQNSYVKPKIKFYNSSKLEHKNLWAKTTKNIFIKELAIIISNEPLNKIEGHNYVLGHKNIFKISYKDFDNYADVNLNFEGYNNFGEVLYNLLDGDTENRHYDNVLYNYIYYSFLNQNHLGLFGISEHQWENRKYLLDNLDQSRYNYDFKVLWGLKKDYLQPYKDHNWDEEIKHQEISGIIKEEKLEPVIPVSRAVDPNETVIIDRSEEEYGTPLEPIKEKENSIKDKSRKKLINLINKRR